MGAVYCLCTVIIYRKSLVYWDNCIFSILSSKGMESILSFLEVCTMCCACTTFVANPFPNISVPLIDKVKALYDEAGHRKDWLVFMSYLHFLPLLITNRAALRLASSILEKVVEGLSPAMTAMLVKEKEVPVGINTHTYVKLMTVLIELLVIDCRSPLDHLDVLNL